MISHVRRAGCAAALVPGCVLGGRRKVLAHGHGEEGGRAGDRSEGCRARRAADWRDLARDFPDGRLMVGGLGVFYGLEWPS